MYATIWLLLVLEVKIVKFSCVRKSCWLLQGLPRLVKALSETYSPLFGRNIDMLQEILVTSGAYESLFCAVQGLINPGDEVSS